MQSTQIKPFPGDSHAEKALCLGGCTKYAIIPLASPGRQWRGDGFQKPAALKAPLWGYSHSHLCPDTTEGHRNMGQKKGNSLSSCPGPTREPLLPFLTKEMKLEGVDAEIQHHVEIQHHQATLREDSASVRSCWCGVALYTLTFTKVPFRSSVDKMHRKVQERRSCSCPRPLDHSAL